MAGLDPATQRDAKTGANEIGAPPLGPRVKPGDDVGWGCGQLHFSGALARLGLIDDCAFVVLARTAGHEPRLLDGLTRMSELTLAERSEFASGAVVVRV